MDNRKIARIFLDVRAVKGEGIEQFQTIKNPDFFGQNHLE
jgi:hypothetical protein